jgi:hypothetical protein
MFPAPDELMPVKSWTNGRKAVVELLQDRSGASVIRKVYRPGFRRWMFREYAMAAYVSSRTSLSPRVLAFRPWRSEMFIQYLPGQRVLEWVLTRFGKNLNMAEFDSFRGLDPPNNVDPSIADAFGRFRQSTSEDVVRLKAAIRDSYAVLHRLKVKHGSADPRNVLYHNGRIFIIDFDNARPSLDPAAIDYEELHYWYGIGRSE